ncbi:MAG: carboxymuconolactone decarboxylase family protein [Archangium sp.]|nr:carboxymuconolactone decarboxylase family protein [Archangium sp.]
MSRIATPPTVADAPPASQRLLDAVKQQLGSVPNLFLVVANSPAALEGYLGLSSALGKGELDAKTRNRVALRVAELNGCDYCLSAHTYLGTNVAKLEPAELTTNRDGHSSDLKAEAALLFVGKVVQTRGHVSDADVRAVKAAGYNDAQVVELVLHVALNTLTNYINTVAQTDIDFPHITKRAA